MKHYYKLNILLYTIIFFSCTLAGRAQNELRGKITDLNTGSPLTGANVYLPDLKLGAAANDDGSYSIKNIPSGTYLVEVRYSGYATFSQSVGINGNKEQDFALTISAIEGQEVVIHGNAIGSDIYAASQPVVEVPNSYLAQNASTNVIDAVAKVPGVSAITDGQSISKPVIRGLGYNRLVTLNDGVPQEGQQWGDEFGIEVDQNSVDRVEILKGPASLVYGSDALAGVVNLLPEKPLPEGEVKGDLLMGYQTNNGLINNSLHIAGTQNGISWSGRLTNIMAHSYQDPNDGYVINSQFRNIATDETFGIHRKWGFSQLHFSYFELQTGIVDGTRGPNGELQRNIAIDSHDGTMDSAIYVDPTNQEKKSYTPFVINQLVKQTKLVWDNDFKAGEGDIIARFSWQRNQRQENNDPTIPDISDIYYYLNSYTYDLRYESPDRNNFNYAVGINGLYQDSKNLGTLLLIPEYTSFSAGAFAIANKKIGKLTLSAGVRYDTRQFTGHDSWIDSSEAPVAANTPGALHRFTGYTSNFSGVSGSVGGTYNFTDAFYTKLNIARGFRAPNVAETGSNGIHDGTVVYEIGNPNLQPEQSLEFDVAPGIRTKNFTFEVDVFSNSISNYIFPKAVLDANGHLLFDSSTAGFGPAPVFKYTQTNAVLTGGEAMLDIHPASVSWFDFYAAYDMVNAKLQGVPDSVQYLPFVPPARLQAAVTFTAKKLCKSLHNAYVRFGFLHAFEQNQEYLQSAIYTGLNTSQTPAEYNASRAPTAAYTLLNAGIGSDIIGKDSRKICSLYISADNLANTAYMDYMSRFKYYPANYNSNPPRVGVYNMGKNISLKLLIPIGQN